MLARLRNRREHTPSDTVVGESEVSTAVPAADPDAGLEEPRPRRERPLWRVRLQEWLGTITRPAVAAGMIVFGTVILVVAWMGTSGRTDVAEQLTWFAAAGISGLAFVLLGGVWIADHEIHRATRRLDRFERDVTRLHGAIVGSEESPAPVPGTPAPYPVTPPDEVLVVPHGETYHRANCLVIRKKPEQERFDRDAVPDTLRPCVICGPDGVG